MKQPPAHSVGPLTMVNSTDTKAVVADMKPSSATHDPGRREVQNE